MSSQSSTQPDFSSDEALLIEYLDDELTQSDRRWIEDRLAKEPELREALAKLEESWRCLDLLETFPADKERVETTLETVVLHTEQAVTRQTGTEQHRFSWKWGAKPLVLILLFGIGLFVGGRLTPDKNFFLRVASPIIERLDMYLLLYDRDPELLPLLAQRRVFLPPLPEGKPPIDPQEYSPSPVARMLDSYTIFPTSGEVRRRIDQINNLDDALFKQFYHNNEKFNEFSMEKKRRLLAFHERIELSPQRSELLQTLQGYYHWQKSLQTYERAEINQPRLTVEQRVALIASMKKRLEANQISPGAIPFRDDEQNRPSLEELAVILQELDWQEQEYVLNLPPEQAVSYLARLFRRQ